MARKNDGHLEGEKTNEKEEVDSSFYSLVCREMRPLLPLFTYFFRALMGFVTTKFPLLRGKSSELEFRSLSLFPISLNARLRERLRFFCPYYRSHQSLKPPCQFCPRTQLFRNDIVFLSPSCSIPRMKQGNITLILRGTYHNSICFLCR